MTGTPISNYLLKIDLEPGNITSPRISRTLSMPATSTFNELHHAIQAAFEWDDSHTWEFTIWSTTKLSQNNSLRGHKLLNLANYSIASREEENSNDPRHIQEDLQRLKTGQSFGRHKIPKKEVRTTRLCEILERSRYNGKLISYLYDFGDNWWHFIYP